MPNSIERDVYVLRDTLKNPISYVRGTDLLPIMLHFRDFTIPSGATAKVFVAKNDGNAVYGGATITGNDVTVDVTQQMFITLGVNLMQVEIDSGNETLVTFEQPVMVTPNLKAGDLPDSTTDVDFIDKIIEQAQEAVNDANAALETANTAISGANTAVESANSAAQNANNAAEELQDKVDAGDFTASVQVGTTTTLAPGEVATVNNSGTSKDAVLNFGIPKGDPGTAASIQVGTTQTVQPEENAEVVNIGTTTAAVLNFKIPRGEDGMTDLVARYEDASEYTAIPTSDAPIVINDLSGKTQQTQTNGYQLFNASKLPIKTQGGASVTYNGDGSFTISGSGILSEHFQAIVYNYTHEETINLFKPAVIHGLRKNGEKKTNPYFRVVIRTLTGSFQSKEITDDFELTEELLNDEGFYISYDFYGNIGEEIIPGTIKPMLYQDGDGTFEPFSGGVASPSPDWEQRIAGVGDMGYFDGNLQKGYYNTSGVYTSADNYVCTVNKIECKQSDSINVKLETSATSIIVSFFQSSGTFISQQTGSGTSITATAPANAGYCMISINRASIEPQTAGHITVTINGKYASRVESHGVNLFDASKLPSNSRNGVDVTNNGDGSFTIGGQDTSSGEFIIYHTLSHEETIKLLKAGTVKINQELSKYPYYGITASYDSKGQGLFEINSAQSNKQSYEITQEMLDNPEFRIRYFIYVGSGFAISKRTIKPMLYQDGDGTWQPYRHTSIQFPLTNPLYDGDKICYVKPGESYINSEGYTVVADRMLYGHYHENGRAVFDGSEDEAWEILENIGQCKRFIILVGSRYKKTNWNYRIKCNKFLADEPNIESNWSVSGANIDTYKGRCTLVNGSARFVYNYTSLEEWKSFLNSNNVEVVYELAHPYFEPFEDQTPFYNLRSFDKLTYIYSDDPLNPTLTVDVAKNQTGGYIFESLAQAMKNAQKAEAMKSFESRLQALESQAVENI